MRLFAPWCHVAVRYSVLTHAVCCWCWPHWGMMPLFLRCPSHGKGHISFPHPEWFPFLHSLPSTLGTTPLSPRLVPWHRRNFWRLDLYTAIISPRPQVKKQSEVEGEVAWANMILLLMCVIPSQRFYTCRVCMARVLVAQLPWGVLPALILLKHLLQHPWSSLDLGW